jgi:hypothetical protein
MSELVQSILAIIGLIVVLIFQDVFFEVIIFYPGGFIRWCLNKFQGNFFDFVKKDKELNALVSVFLVFVPTIIILIILFSPSK